MPKRKYLVLFRNPPTGGPPGGPSPEQMQQMFAAYNAWKDQFKDAILDMGDKLKAGGRVVTTTRVADGPYTLNRAVAVGQEQGPEAGLAVLEGLVPPGWLEGHYLWDAVLADLHHRAGHTGAAERHRDQALAAAPTEAVRQLLQRRLSGSRPRAPEGD